jgi:hypothetical protein
MTTFPNAPKVARGGIVTMNPVSGRILRVISLQYNPDTVTRTLAAQTLTQEPGDRLDTLRLKGPPHESIKVDAEFDATEQLEHPNLNKANEVVAKVGLAAQLAALETLVYPSSKRLRANERQADRGTIEITPIESPLTLFVWTRHRTVPVRLTDFSITEEAFDSALNPIRAKVTLGMRVLTTDDLGYDHTGGGVYLAYHQHKETLADRAHKSRLGELGLNGIGGV